MSLKQVIVMRKDLNMRKGKMVAQGSHASLLSYMYMQAGAKYKTLIYNWCQTGMTKICVSVDSEQELLELYKKLNNAKIPCMIVTDAGRTEFDGIPTKTCLAAGPWEESELDKFTGNLKLL